VENFASLWEELKNGNQEVKEVLAQLYMPFVRQLASGIKRKLGNSVDYDDLVGDGSYGLLRAINTFDPGRGVKFETYATPVVRGAIFNGLRSLDWVPERTREKSRALQRAMDQLAAAHGRPSTEDELAAELKISTQEVYELINDLGCLYLLSLNQPLPELEDDDITIMDVVEDKKSPSPSLQVEFEDLQRLILEALSELDDREQVLIKGHYFEGKTFEKVAEELGISKQRISQIHIRALKKLKAVMTGMEITPELLEN